ncbi:mechanosensitive ion channel family protein [Kiritimatiellaeota bacterium B1221]|nr:mechanosensitive ion channel family protein [Kiritimatiellaeota bacterium B1221]
MNIEAILMEKLTSMGKSFVETLPLLAIAAVILILTGLISILGNKILHASLRKSQLRRSLKDLFATLLKVVIWTFGILITLTVVFPNLTPAKLLTALGLGSVAVGLAFKDIFENFFAGILIMLRKPMRIGDYIECENIFGKIEHITVRETYIRVPDDTLELVPNSYLFKNPVKVLTDHDQRRFEIVVGVAYGEDVDHSREVIQSSLKDVEEVDTNRSIEVFAREFNSSSVDFTVRWWATSTPIAMHKSRDKVITAIKRALDENGIEIPFPYRTLTFKEPLHIQPPEPRAESDERRS